MDEESSLDTNATELTAADPVSHAASEETTSIQTVDLGSPSTPRETEDDEELINLEGASDDFKTETALFDDESEPASEEPATEITEKPKVEHKLSNDTTDQIQQVVATDEVNLDSIRKTIFDAVELEEVENIFGQSRQSLLGPVVVISSESSVEEEEEHDLDLSYLAAMGILKIKEPINRTEYEDQFQTLKSKTRQLRRKNGLLNRKISEYYRKRKMIRVFEEPTMDMFETLLGRYEAKIIDYSSLQTKAHREKEAVDNEITDMTTLCNEQLAELVKSFAAMQSREKEIGYGLIDSQTGKAVSNKVVDRLLLRQKAKSEEIASIRLAYIKRRDKVKEIENKIKALETIGGTLHLMDFEQLRMENQTYTDKIEERDEELMRLRDRYSHAMQSLAHIREKINVIDVEIENRFVMKNTEDIKVSEFREYLNKLKIQRDIKRAQTDELKENSGLLTYSKLLLDMEKGENETVQYREQLKNLKATNEDYRIKLANIRSKIEKTEHVQSKRTYRRRKSRTTIGRGPRYIRPTIAYPIIPKIRLLKARISRIRIDDI